MEEVQNSQHKPYMTDLTNTLTIDGFLTGHKQPPNLDKQNHGPTNERAKCEENLHEFTGTDSSTLERVSYEGAFKDFLSCDIPDYPIMKVANYKKLAKLRYSIKATAKSRLQPLSQSASSTVQPVSKSPSSMLHSLGQSDSRTLEPLSTLPLGQSASSILQTVHKSASSPSSGTEPIIQQSNTELQAQAMIPSGYKWLNKNTKGNVLISESPDKQFLNITYRDIKNNILFSKDVEKKDLLNLQENLVECQTDRKQKSGKRDQRTNEKKRKGDTQMDEPFAKAKLDNTFCHAGKGQEEVLRVPKRLKSKENELNLSSNDVTPCASSSRKNDSSSNGLHENSPNEKITLSLADSILQSLDDFFGLDNDNVRSDCNKPVSNKSSRSNECVPSESLLQHDQAMVNEGRCEERFLQSQQQCYEPHGIGWPKLHGLQSVNCPSNVRYHTAPFTQISFGSILPPVEMNDNSSNMNPSYGFHPHGQPHSAAETPLQQVDTSMAKEHSISWFDIPTTDHNYGTSQNGAPYEGKGSSSPCMPTADHNVITRQYEAVYEQQSRQLNYPHETNIFSCPPGPLVQPSFRQVAHPMLHPAWCRQVHAVPPMAQTQPQSHNMSPYNMY